MGRSRFTTKGLPLQAQKFELSPSAGYHPHQKKIESLCPSPDHRQHIGQKVFLIAFRLILPKILPVAHIFSNTIMTYLLEQNPFIQNSVQ